jgi:predicted aldo/keto reductase-like oxidoreductase
MNEKRRLKRRQFMKSSTLGIVGAGLAGNYINLKAVDNPTPSLGKVSSYRPLGNTGFKISDISLGGVTNVEVIKAMLEAGVNYIDTAESYGRGKSEISMGQAIKNVKRESLFINTKLHIKENEDRESILNRAEQCLKRLDTPYIDCLMTHNPSSLEMVTHEPFFQACRQLKEQGKLRFVGISSHGQRRGREGEAMDKILLAAVRDGRYSIMLLVYNFIQNEMAERVIEACQKQKIGVTLMKTNPVGRYLSMKERINEMKSDPDSNPDRLKRMEEYLKSMEKTAEEGEWFIKKHQLTDPAEIRVASTRYVLSNPGVATVLARTDSFEDVEQFLEASGSTLSTVEAKKLAAFKQGPGKFYCRHACGLCESSCPHHVPVNTIMRYNHYFEAQGQEKYALSKYLELSGEKAAACSDCPGFCQQNCPYDVPIQGLLCMAHERLTLT